MGVDKKTKRAIASRVRLRPADLMSEHRAPATSRRLTGGTAFETCFDQDARSTRLARSGTRVSGILGDSFLQDGDPGAGSGAGNG